MCISIEDCEVPPKQIEAGVAVGVNVGEGTTFKVVEAVPVHPIPSVAVTVYVVLTNGDTVIEFPITPLLQTYVEPPETVIVIELPEHKVGLLGVKNGNWTWS